MPKIEVVIPAEYLCPITHELMKDPVSTCDGHIYERQAITQWLEKHDTSPVTNLKLENNQLTAIHVIKNQISAFLEKNGLCTYQAFLKVFYEIFDEESSLYQLLELRYSSDYLTNKIDKNGTTLLHYAAKFKHTEIVAWLLNEGLDSNVKDEKGNTPLHGVTDVKVAELLLAKAASLEVTNNKDETPLHLAAAYGRANIVELLLRRGANVQARNKEGMTPEELHEYVASTSPYDVFPGDYSKTKYFLISHEPDFKLEHGSKLNLAIFYNQIDEVDYLLDAMHETAGGLTDLELKNKCGYTPLSLAVVRGMVEVVKKLLAEKVDINTQLKLIRPRPCTTTVLHLAAERSNKEIVQLLLDQGASVSAVDGDNLTPIEVAKKYNRLVIVQLFELHESPKKIAQLETTVKQQAQLIQQLQEQVKELSSLISQLGIQKSSSSNDKSKYSAGFNLSK